MQNPGTAREIKYLVTARRYEWLEGAGFDMKQFEKYDDFLSRATSSPPEGSGRIPAGYDRKARRK